MNKFIFKYENLLGVKERYEELISRKLNKAQKKLEDEKMRLKGLEDYKEDCQHNMAIQMRKGTDAVSLRTYDMFLMQLKRKILSQKEAIEKCNQEVNQYRLELMQAAKEKKTFEKLREREKENFYYIEKKEEENFVDQLVTFNNFKSN
ncbi:flagellar export protein FliJ [Marinisporobacter balticus]|uniref:Flagellar FliJ protein n=1 Tax=Marinisporobacter balticus TaxID=2018667 RepID=A0A4R2LB07_9FIRM|nr:flagellar export protein FliJ [Marinisporobacter balticus]TCO79948.1 flagellar FliJ protein [Marinisporobacter balticus]